MEDTLQVNKLARKNRHSRVFKWTVLLMARYAKVRLFVNSNLTYIHKLGSKALEISGIRFLLNKLSMSTTRRLVRHISAGSIALLVITSTPYSDVSTHSAMDSPYYSDGFLLADQDGYLTKLNPQTLDGDRATMTDRVVHTVAAGETVSQIAAKYNLKGETLLWENNIYNQNSIKIGQKLVIPPVNGVSHKVVAGETLDKIAAKYKVDGGVIIKQNQLEGTIIAKGQELFIPGGKAVESPVYRATPSRDASETRYVANSGLSGTSAEPGVGKSMIYPTRGKLTQGFHAGHYAFDIADTSKPPIWAAMSGVVESVGSGWSGGYGNHVVVDHGNGLKTLYAHMEYYSVQGGQSVSQGEVLGKMGRTGRVYGVTGIHLHFEVIKNGVKQYPGNYF